MISRVLYNNNKKILLWEKFLQILKRTFFCPPGFCTAEIYYLPKSVSLRRYYIWKKAAQQLSVGNTKYLDLERFVSLGACKSCKYHLFLFNIW